MKIFKYVASALALATMALFSTSCSNENDEVDSKGKYLFEFVVEGGSLDDAQIQELNDSIDSKIFGGVGLAHYPLLTSEAYAIESYNQASQDTKTMVDAIINPIADKYNITDFKVRMQLKDMANDRVLRSSKVFEPTVTRQDYNVSVEITGAAEADAQTLETQIAQLKAQVEALYGGATTQNGTKGYAVRTFINDNSAAIKALVNTFAQTTQADSIMPVVTVTDAEGKVAKSTLFASTSNSYTEKYAVTSKGSLSDAQVDELMSELKGIVFDGIAEVQQTGSKSAVMSNFNSKIAKRTSAIQKQGVDYIANKYNIGDFEVSVLLVNNATGKTVSSRTFVPHVSLSAYKITYEYYIPEYVNDMGDFTLYMNSMEVFDGGTQMDIAATTETIALQTFTDFNAAKGASIQTAVNSVAKSDYAVIKDVYVVVKLIKLTGNKETIVDSKEYRAN